MLARGVADIEFTVTMETGPEAMTFVRFIPYSRGYVINAVPSSFALSPASPPPPLPPLVPPPYFSLYPNITKDLLLDGFTNLVITIVLLSSFLANYQETEIFPLENYRKIGRFAQSGLRDCLKKKFVGSNFEDATFFTTVIFFFSFVLVAFKVIGSMESHRSERSTRRSMHELLAIRWKSRNQISRNQFLTYSRFFCRNVMKTVSTNGFIPFGCFAGFYFFAFETGPNAAALVATIFLPCILYACRSIQKTVVIFKQHSVFLSYSFRLLNGTLNDNFFRWKGK